MLFDFTTTHKAGATMGITDYISRHPVFEAQKEDNYEERFVINRIKDINRQIGTGFTKELDRVIEENTIKALDNYASDQTVEIIEHHVNEEAKAIKWRLTDYWTRQLTEKSKPLENLTSQSVPNFTPKFQSINQTSYINATNTKMSQRSSVSESSMEETSSLK